MSKTIRIYKLDGTSFEAERESCYFTSRTAINERKKCPYKGYATNHAMGRGLAPAREGEDLVLGSAVHKGMEEMLVPDYMEASELAGHCGQMAWDYMMERKDNLDIQGDPNIHEINPEAAELLTEEQAALAQGLVYAFGKRRLEGVLERYEIVSLEEEVNWLLGAADDGRWIVVMSRWDGAWRDREDGRLYVVSYKTLKTLDNEVQKKWESDSQRFSEGLAMQARYGEEPGGILYFWFLKGRKDAYGEDLGYKRYKNGLVRPYANLEMLSQGSPQPFMFKFAGEWWDKGEEKTKKIDWRRWKRVDAWKEVGMEEWLGWLEQGLVEPELGIDYLGAAVATDPFPVVWDSYQAQRWADSQLLNERDWIGKLGMLEEHPDWVDAVMSRTDEACVDFKRPCRLSDHCWGGRSLERMVDEGRLAPRKANHPVEFEGEGGE